MKKITILLLTFGFAVGAFAQTEQQTKKNKKEKAVTSSLVKAASPLELAKSAIVAHGGDSFKNMKTLIVRGTADVSGSPTMTFPAPFVMTLAGDRYRLEISTPFVAFKQIFDGQQTLSSNGEVNLPPLNRLGLPLLPRIEENGFVVSALPEKSKKKNGFRITSPEGFYTDFFVDEKSGQIKGYEASYEISGRTVTTSVEIDKVREVNGVKVPERYSQRFDVGQLTIYSDFKAKEILVNSQVADDVFTMN